MSSLAMLQPLSVRAVQSVTLGWNPSQSTNIQGYIIYYGTASQSYTSQITVFGDATNTTFWGLAGQQTYFFAARSFKSTKEQSDLSAELAYTLPPDATNQPPIFTKLLTGKAFIVGQNLTFSTAGMGTGTLKYQWNFNGQNIPDATNAVLTLNNTTPDQAGTYFVTLSDDIGTTNSAAALLSLHTAVASSQAAATLTTVNGLATPNDAGNQYAFDVSGTAGYTYVVQASTDLQNWTSVQTNIAPFTFIDTSVDASAQRFYRAFQQ